MNGLLRVGCIVDDQAQSQWLLELVERSKSSGTYSIDLLVVQKPKHRAGGAIPGLLAAGCFSMLSWLENIVVRAVSGYTRARQTHALEAIPVPRLEVQPACEGDSPCYRYIPEDLARLREHGLDVLLQVDRSGMLVGDVLEACRFGILSLGRSGEHAGLEGPPGFWEVVHRAPSTGFAIQRLAPDSSRGEVLFKGALNTAPLYLLNAVNVQRKAWFFLHRFLERLGRDRALPSVVELGLNSYSRHAAPSLRAQARYLGRTFAHLFERASRRMAGFRWRWSVAYQFTDDWRTADLSRSTVIPNPPGRFFADPCVVNWQGMNVCFVEDYLRSTGRARITAFRIDRDGHEELGVALEEPFHLSYPFVFQANGELYMCPETEQAREIRLYKCTGFPLRWELHRVLMKNVAAVDTSIFHHHGRWWMLTNIDSAEINDYRSELHAFHADSFDSDQWRPHPGNPLVLDSARARNGGLIRSGEEIYRVFQVQGFDVYGESMGVARIDELSEQAYSETAVVAILPDFLPGIAGTHSLSVDGDLLALDFVRRERY
jgi:hypothetical protein